MCLSASNNAARFNPAFATVTTLFFMWGFVTATIDPALIRRSLAAFNALGEKRV